MTDPQMPVEEYRALEAVNWSTLKYMDQSPKHYLHACAKQWDARHLRIGDAAHCAVLEPEKYENRFAIWEGARRGKDWQQFKELHETAGNPILTRSEADSAEAIRDAVLLHPPAKQLLDDSTHRELSIVKHDEETGLLLKGRPDLVTDDTLADLKTSKDPSPRWFWKTASSLYYHTQLAFYLDLLSELDDRPRRCVIIAVESMQPHDVVVHVVPDDLISIGRRHYRRLLTLLAECHASGKWPGAVPGETELHIPDFALETSSDELDWSGIEEIEI